MMLMLSPSLLLAENSDTVLPDIAFLEFIGEWETEQGEWIDPVMLEDESFDNIQENAEEANSEN